MLTTLRMKKIEQAPAPMLHQLKPISPQQYPYPIQEVFREEKWLLEQI